MHSPDWGKNWSDASSDAGWKLIVSWASAHHNDHKLGINWDSSSFERQRPIPGPSILTHQLVHVSISKHGNYWSDDACDAGANYADECDSASAVTWQLQYRNAGESRARPSTEFSGGTIPYPASSLNQDADVSGQTYDVWSGFKFGESTAYFEVLSKGHMRWAGRCTENQLPTGEPGPYECYASD